MFINTYNETINNQIFRSFISNYESGKTEFTRNTTEGGILRDYPNKNYYKSTIYDTENVKYDIHNLYYTCFIRDINNKDTFLKTTKEKIEKEIKEIESNFYP